MFQINKDIPNVKDCCKVPEALELKERTGDLKIYICKTCQCKHRRFKVEPGNLGVLLAALGKKK